MSARTNAAGALLAMIVGGTVTVAVALSGGTANAVGTQSPSVSVGRAQPGSGPALDAVLGLTRSASDGQTYRAAGTYSAGSALTLLASR